MSIGWASEASNILLLGGSTKMFVCDGESDQTLGPILKTFHTDFWHKISVELVYEPNRFNRTKMAVILKV